MKKTQIAGFEKFDKIRKLTCFFYLRVLSNNFYTGVVCVFCVIIKHENHAKIEKNDKTRKLAKPTVNIVIFACFACFITSRSKPHLSLANFVVLTFYLSSLWHGYSIEQEKSSMPRASQIDTWNMKMDEVLKEAEKGNWVTDQDSSIMCKIM